MSKGSVSVPTNKWALLHPRHWLAWLGILFWALLVQVPYPCVQALGALMGALAGRFNGKRRRFVRININAAFADKTVAQRELIFAQVFRNVGMAIMETGVAWFWPKWRLRRLYTVDGADTVRNLQAQGQGVILLGSHLSTLDIGSAFMGLEFTYDGLYRKNNNAVYDAVQKWGRENYCPGTAIERSNMRAMVKTLRAGKSIWYAPDQDFGAEGSVFVNHFGVRTAMLTATSKLAKMGRATVVPFYQLRVKNPTWFGPRFQLSFLPPLQDFPCGDDTRDAQVQCDLVESIVRQAPEQYLWTQRRFKTRPSDGDDPHSGLRYK